MTGESKFVIWSTPSPNVITSATTGALITITPWQAFTQPGQGVAENDMVGGTLLLTTVDCVVNVRSPLGSDGTYAY